MSKSSELRVLRCGRSVDAPIKYHHRTGDEEGGAGNILDLYVQEESAEEVYFGNADEHAREMFIKGFRLYLKKVFTEQERRFLQGLLAGKESPYKIGRALGVEHFSFLQGIQRKAYKNVKPLAKLAKITGWSGAETFTETIYIRLEQLNAGFSLNEIIPQNKRRQRKLKYFREYRRVYRLAHIDKERARDRAYYWANREKRKKEALNYKKEHYQERLAYSRKYNKENREKRLLSWKEYRIKNREKINFCNRERRANDEYRAKHRDYERARRARKKAEREAAKMALQAVALSELANVLETGANV